MHRGKEAALLLTGVVLGGVLAGPAANAATELFAAQRSVNRFFVNGREVEMEAYVIEGHNYVQLRDIGQEVGFNVYWDGTVQVRSGVPYTGEAPTTTEQEAVEENQNHSTQADPAIFTGGYTREGFNALRTAILTGSGGPVVMTENERSALLKAEAAVGEYPGYDSKTDTDGSVTITSKYSSSYEEAAKVCREFISTLDEKTDAEKLYAFACLVCDHLEYDANSTTTPRTLFTETAKQKGNCMSYAHGFKFLCDIAGIPCVYVHSDIHQWNEVYVNGSWECVDLTSFKISYGERGTGNVLINRSDLQGSIFWETEPQLTRFAKELLVPGSTR